MTLKRIGLRLLQVFGGLLLLFGAAGCFPFEPECATSDITCSFVASALYLSVGSAAPCSGTGGSFPSFHSYLSSGLDLQGTALCALKDGGLVAAGVTDTGTTLQGRSPLIAHSGSLSDALIVRWDASGNILWFTYLGGSASSLRIEGIAEANDGGVILLGDLGSPDNFPIGGLSPILPGTLGDNQNVFVARLRADGGLAWHTALGGGGATGEYAPGDLVITSDGGILLSGNATSTGATPTMGGTTARVPFAAGDFSNILVAKLSAAGELLWFRYIGGGGGASTYSGVSLVQTADGNFVIGGGAAASPANVIEGRTAILPFNTGDDNDGLAVKIDPEGNLLWFSYLGGGGPGFYYDGLGAAAFSDGSVVLVGQAQGAGVSNIGGVTALNPYGVGEGQNGLVWKLDAAGNLQWFTYFGGGGGTYGLRDAGRTADGGLVVAGEAQNATATIGSVTAVAPYEPAFAAALLAKLRPSGSLEWFTYASSSAGGYEVMGIKGAVGGGLTTVGSAQNSPATLQGKTPLNPYNIGDLGNMFLLKLDGQGRL